MVMRLTAAICGATIFFACSSIAMARTEVRAVHSYTVDRGGSAIIGAASIYNPFQPDREGGTSTATGAI
jgi:rare lipoprotein A